MVYPIYPFILLEGPKNVSAYKLNVPNIYCYLFVIDWFKGKFVKIIKLYNKKDDW